MLQNVHAVQLKVWIQSLDIANISCTCIPGSFKQLDNFVTNTANRTPVNSQP